MMPGAETIVRFGAEHRLLGVLNHREEDAPWACLLVNVGVTQHIGPRRLNVKLARRLAHLGVSSFRFDLSGLGDSLAADPHAGYADQSVTDMQHAMDEITVRAGIRNFVILGICSGAVVAYRVAQQDERVVGLMMYDGYAFPTWRTRLVHDLRRALSMPVGKAFQKAASRLQRIVGLRAASAPVSIFYSTRDRSAPDKHRFAEVMNTLTSRNVRVLLAYSGSLLALHNHQGQLSHAFAGQPFLQVIDYRYRPDIDHIATAQAAQQDFLAMVLEWVNSLRRASR
jgi:alpha-beta hydrolase superfamily lysophospholipase